MVTHWVYILPAQEPLAHRAGGCKKIMHKTGYLLRRAVE